MEEIPSLKRINEYKCILQMPKELQDCNTKKPKVEIYVNKTLETQQTNEWNESNNNVGGFTPALKQLYNVSLLPGIVKSSIGLPDIHSGYGFSIGHVAAMDMNNPNSVVSPGGVGFDINCGVRLIRTNLTLDTFKPYQDIIAKTLFNTLPVGVGSRSSLRLSNTNVLDDILLHGMRWCVREGYAWAEDIFHCEEEGNIMGGIPENVSEKAKKRGKMQIGTLGAGNHYCEIQTVDTIFDPSAAAAMNLESNQIVIMIHTGSRGLGHQIATDSILDIDIEDNNDIKLNRELSCTKIKSINGQKYLSTMACAANFAWVNRTYLQYLVRQCFSKIFQCTADDLGMNLIYDVSHNIAKVETHTVDGIPRELLVHRKGATRAFPPFHPMVPVDYQGIGQPVLIGGSMGTSSYVMVGTDTAMKETFGTTCHGAGRAISRSSSHDIIHHEELIQRLKDKGITVCTACPRALVEEAPEVYKDVSEVVQICHSAGLSTLVARTKPLVVIKG